jgi:hypothetical protein
LLEHQIQEVVVVVAAMLTNTVALELQAAQVFLLLAYKVVNNVTS